MRIVRPGFTPSLGSGVLVAVAIGNVALWLAARPANQPTARYLGELCGAEAVLLFACSLVLATLLPPIERAFGGLDRVVVWHRRAAIGGVILLVPHRALVATSVDPYATSLEQGLGVAALLGLLVLSVWALAPRLRAARWPGPIQQLARTTFERWLTAHRLTGLFVALAVAHGALVDPVLRASTALRITYLAIGAIGIAAYVYREIFARFVLPTHDYTVATVGRPNDTTLEVALEPAGAPLSFIPGQFVLLAFGGASGWQRHPFSVASAPSERRLEVAIKAVGDYTRDLYEKLRPGLPGKGGGAVRRLRLPPRRREPDLDCGRDRHNAVHQLDPRAEREAGYERRLLLRGCETRRRALSRRSRRGRRRVRDP